MGSTATPTRRCSRSRSRSSATGRAPSSRSSPPLRRSTWAWGSTLNWQCPGSFQARGLGSSDTPGCPKETWCVKNAGNYRGSMNVTDALATSPNTAFAKLIQQVGVPRAVDMAVRLGLRSYATARNGAGVRPGKQRKPGRLHQATEHRLVHPGPVPAQRARAVQCGGDAGLRWDVVSADPDRQDLRPPRQRGVVHHRAVRPGGARGTGEHASRTR